MIKNSKQERPGTLYNDFITGDDLRRLHLRFITTWSFRFLKNSLYVNGAVNPDQGSNRNL